MSIETEIKSSIVLNIHQKSVINLLFTGNWINEKSNEFFKPFGLSPQQFNVLRILRGRKGEPTNLIDIQERMISKMSNTTRLIEKLKQKDLVNRVQCEENRRKIEVTITKSGLELLQNIDQQLSKHEKETVGNLSEGELKVLNELLDKLRV